MSRKNFFKSFGLIFTSLSTFLLFTGISFAQTSTRTKLPNFAEVGGVIKGFNDNILQNLVLVLSGAALVVFLAGLVKFVFDRNKGANDKTLADDKKSMMWGVIALFVLVSLWGIISLFQDILGIPKDNNINLPKICVDGNCQASSNALAGTGSDPAGDWGGGATGKLGDTEINGDYSTGSVTLWPSQFSSGTGTYKYVAELQNFLNTEMGANLVVDGRYGANTVTAVKAFQTRNKLVADGVVGPSTKAVILYRYLKDTPPSTYAFATNWPDLAFGSRGPEVGQLQAVLNDSGCYDSRTSSNEDNIFGPRTKEAVINFQNANYLKEDAIVGPSTRAVIMSTETTGCRR